MKILPRIFIIVLFAASYILPQSVVSGKILGVDGNPLIKARADLNKSRSVDPILTVHPGKNGSYEIKIDKDGFYVLQFEGVYHQILQVPILVDKQPKINLNVNLKPLEYFKNFFKLEIAGKFNSQDKDSVIEMKKGAGGVYTAEVKTNAKEISYQVLGAEINKVPMEGTDAIDFTYTGNGRYLSVIKPKKGIALITFNPAKLSRSASDAKVVFRDTAGPASVSYGIFKKMENRQKKYYALAAKSEEVSKHGLAWPEDKKEIETALAEEKNPELKNLLYLSYIQLAIVGERNLNTDLVKEAFKNISPDSFLWSLDPRPLTLLFRIPPKEIEGNYLQEVLNKNHDSEVLAFLYYVLASRAWYLKDFPSAKMYYTALMNEYGDTEYARIAKSQLDIRTRILKGQEIPDFSVISSDDSTKNYSRKSMLGKIYLIDFWATWCGPCRREMPNLQKAYEKYKGRGFEILSLSFDKSPEDVTKFRKGEWKMPWLHAFVNNGFQSILARDFEVSGIPKPILVDSTGHIIASELQLRGERLMQTLKEVYGE